MTDQPYRINERFPTKTTRLLRLTEEAGDARRARASQWDPIMTHRVRAAATLDAALTDRVATVVDLNGYMTRVATLVQICEGAIGGMATSIDTECLPTSWISPFAVALVDVMHFIAACAGEGEQLGLRMAIRRKRGRIVAGVEVRGEYCAVAPAAATRGLLRAAGIIDDMGGRLERCIDAERTVFGVNFDRTGGRKFLNRSRNAR